MEPYILAANGGRNLYFEFSLLEYDGIPIIFLATDDEKRVYLCECTDTRFGEQNWTIVLTDYDTVIRVMARQLTIYEAIQKNGNHVILAAYDYETGKFTQNITSFDRLNPENLPDQEAMVWLTNERALDSVFKLFMKHSSSASVTPSATIPYMTTNTTAAGSILRKAADWALQSKASSSIGINQAENGFAYDENGVKAA